MANENLHLVLVTAFFIASYAIILAFAGYGDAGNLTGMITSDEADEQCSDGTPLYSCSEESPGNKCMLEREGPRLEFSSDCYY